MDELSAIRAQLDRTQQQLDRAIERLDYHDRRLDELHNTKKSTPSVDPEKVGALLGVWRIIKKSRLVQLAIGGFWGMVAIAEAFSDELPPWLAYCFAGLIIAGLVGAVFALLRELWKKWKKRQS